jgi:ankyrin repeat protein
LMYRLDPNQLDQHGLAPIHYAAYAGNFEIIELLLTYGADKYLNDARGYSALIYAQQSNHSDISQKLLK